MRRWTPNIGVHRFVAGLCCEDVRRAPVSVARPFLDAIAGVLRWG